MPALKPPAADGMARFVAARLAEDGTARDAPFGQWLLAEVAGGRTDLKPVLAEYAATRAFHRNYPPPGGRPPRIAAPHAR